MEAMSRNKLSAAYLLQVQTLDFIADAFLCVQISIEILRG